VEGASGSASAGFAALTRRRITVPPTRFSTVRPRLNSAIFSLIFSMSSSGIALMCDLIGIPIAPIRDTNSLFSIPSSCASWKALNFAMVSPGGMPRAYDRSFSPLDALSLAAARIRSAW
jgi:hypothetical protein